jgi:hypothetical protein
MLLLLLAVEVPEWALVTLVTITLAALGLAVKYGMAGGDAAATKDRVSKELAKHDTGLSALAAKIDEWAERISGEHREGMAQMHSYLAEHRELAHRQDTRIAVIETVVGIDSAEAPRPRVRRDTPPFGVRPDAPVAPQPWRKKP